MSSCRSGLVVNQVLRLQVLGKLGEHWHVSSSCRGGCQRVTLGLGRQPAAAEGKTGARPPRPAALCSPPPCHPEARRRNCTGLGPCHHPPSRFRTWSSDPTHPPCVRSLALSAPHATFYSLVGMGEAAWREDELRRLGYKVLASCCCGVGDHTLPGVQASLRSRAAAARAAAQRSPALRPCLACPGGAGRPQNEAGRSCKRLARTGQAGQATPSCAALPAQRSGAPRASSLPSPSQPRMRPPQRQPCELSHPEMVCTVCCPTRPSRVQALRPRAALSSHITALASPGHARQSQAFCWSVQPSCMQTGSKAATPLHPRASCVSVGQPGTYSASYVTAVSGSTGGMG